MTDWLDGYLARKMNLSSPLGAFLDPVADKASGLLLMARLFPHGQGSRIRSLQGHMRRTHCPTRPQLMVATALVLMADRMRSPVVTVSTAIIINREIGVSALREWMASMNQRDTVAVGWWGKVRRAKVG